MRANVYRISINLRLFDYEINLIKIEVVAYETSVISVVRLLTIIFERKA